MSEITFEDFWANESSKWCWFISGARNCEMIDIFKIPRLGTAVPQSFIIYFYPKAYGLKFIIKVEGLAWKFSLKNTVLNVGNGLALLGITTVVCEFVLMYFIKVGGNKSFIPTCRCDKQMQYEQNILKTIHGIRIMLLENCISNLQGWRNKFKKKINKYSIFQEKNSVAMKKYDYVKEPQNYGEGQGKSHFGTQTFTVGDSE
jgi:hypothetical protein